MIKLILVVAILLGVCIFGMAVRIIFHKSHKFPETSVGHNAQMHKMGITCPKHDELRCLKTGEDRNCDFCSGTKKE